MIRAGDCDRQNPPRASGPAEHCGRCWPPENRRCSWAREGPKRRRGKWPRDRAGTEWPGSIRPPRYTAYLRRHKHYRGIEYQQASESDPATLLVKQSPGEAAVKNPASAQANESPSSRNMVETCACGQAQKARRGQLPAAIPIASKPGVHQRPASRGRALAEIIQAEGRENNQRELPGGRRITEEASPPQQGKVIH